MKIYIWLFLFMIQCLTALKSQCLDSNDPISNRTANIKTPFGSTVNNFDWRQEYYNFYLINPVTNQGSWVSKLSPFFWQQASPNIKHLQEQPLNAKDFQPNDGWELVQYYFGTGTDPKRIPYLILYNRLEGMLRVFFYVPSSFDYSYNAAKIEIKFLQSTSITQFLQNGMLAYSKMPAKGLDKFDKNIISSAPTYVSSEGNFWLYADFPIAYDACTCNYLTNIFITPYLMNITKIEETQESIVASSPSSTVNNQSGILPVIEGLANQINAVEGAIKKGSAISKSLTTGIGYIESLLPKTKVIETKSFFTPDDDFQLAETLVSKSIKSNPIKFPAWAKELPKIGIALNLIELFTGGGKSQPTPSVAQARQRFKITGTATTDYPLTPVDLYVPGSAWNPNSGATLSKPYYNNTMGIFALVETPKIQFKNKTMQQQGPAYTYTNAWGQSITTTNYNFINWDFKLQDDIKYAINPASGYSQTPVDIKASLIFHVKAKCFGATPDPSILKRAFPPFCTFNGPTSSSLKVSKIGNSDTVTIQTPLMPLSCIKDYVAHLSFVGNSELKTGDGSGTAFSNANFKEDVRLQIVSILAQENDPTKQHTFIAQYQLFPEQAPADIPNTDISDIVNNAVIENLNLTADKTIRAWETATLKGTIQTNGFKLTVIAGKSIDIENPTQELSRNIELLIGLPISCTNTVPAMSPQQLYSFCAKVGEKKYNPVVAFSEPIVNKQLVKETIQFAASPNPFSNQIELSYTIKEETLIDMYITNTLGQFIKTVFKGAKIQGSYTINESTSDLPAGVYFITLRTPQGVEIRKVVKE